MLEVVKTLPGRRFDPRRLIWTAPHGSAAIRVLTEAFGADRVRILGGPGSGDGPPPRPGAEKEIPPPNHGAENGQARGPGPAEEEDAPDPIDDLLKRVKDALTVRGYSPRTRKVYLGQLRRFLEWCGDGVPELPDDPAERGVAYILELIRTQNISKSYQNQIVSALRFLCEGVLGEPRLALEIPRPRKELRLPAVLSQREVLEMLKMARNPKHRALLVLLYSAGLRVGEVVRLRPGDLDVERGLLKVRAGKGRKDRYTLLADRAVKAVRIYRDAYPSEEWLFPGARPERHLTTRSVQRVVKRTAAAAGIAKKVTAHTLRHSFATHLLEGGTNLRIIQELLGHQNTRTTQIYTHVARSTIEAVRSPLDNLE